MAETDIPVTIPDLLTVAAKGIANIERHRTAMAEVAATAKTRIPPPPEVETPK